MAFLLPAERLLENSDFVAPIAPEPCINVAKRGCDYQFGRRRPQVERTLRGHLHCAIDRRIAGTLARIASSTELAPTLILVSH
jgi:hypothetical protein